MVTDTTTPMLAVFLVHIAKLASTIKSITLTPNALNGRKNGT
jgi:hypothetical protein